jgi:hypothetical protein
MIESALRSFPSGAIPNCSPGLDPLQLIHFVSTGPWDPDFATDDDHKEIAGVMACNRDGTFDKSRIWLCGMLASDSRVSVHGKNKDSGDAPTF